MLTITGAVFERGDPGYEEARRATVWNARIPDRFPDLVVQAADAADVVAAVRYAGRHDLAVGIRSGGHSWAANHLRQGGMLLDVSRLDEVTIADDGATAVVGPGCRGHDLCARLEARGRFFPAGHCRGVAVGGYLLQGGYGWDSRALGVACESVIGIDVVTAAGETLHADAEENADLYWAARGAGPGFFAVVTRFHLRLHPAPATMGLSLYAYPLDALDELFTWVHGLSGGVDRRLEMQLLVSRDLSAIGVEGPAIALATPVFAESTAAAEEAVAVFETCPVRHRALLALPFAPMGMAESYQAVTEGYPEGHRYATDNMWTSAPVAELLPHLHRIVETLPPPPSHVLWLNWAPPPTRPDMAYSVEDDIYLALYGVWADEPDDERYADWPATQLRAMEGLASGIQLADENLGQRPARFVTEAVMTRLDALRARYDPDRRFHSWMGRP